MVLKMSFLFFYTNVIAMQILRYNVNSEKVSKICYYLVETSQGP